MIRLIKLSVSCFLLMASLMTCQNESSSTAEGQATTPSSTAQENTSSDTSSKPEEAIFDIPAAKITYRFNGVESGTLTFYFDNYGNRWVREGNFFIANNFNKKERRFWDGEQQIYFDQNPKLNPGKEAVRTTTNKNKANYFAGFAGMTPEQITQGKRFKQIDNVTIADQECSLFKVREAEQYYALWNGVTLKMKTPNSSFEARSVEIIDAIPAELLQLPEGYTIKE